MSALGTDRALFYTEFYMRPWHEIAGAGKSPWVTPGGSTGVDLPGRQEGDARESEISWALYMLLR